MALGGAAYYFYSNAEEEQEQTAAPAAVAETSTTKATREPAAEEKIPKEISAATQETATGNRVISIGIPGRMKNSAASVAAPPPPPAPSHPEGGNRVAALLPGPSAPSAAAAAAARPESSVPDASPTRAAVRALQDSTTERATAALVRTHQSLWSAMDESFFADLDRLSNAQLKARVAQLAAEMKDRTKWEAVRLKEFLAMKEKETSEKCVCERYDGGFCLLDGSVVRNVGGQFFGTACIQCLCFVYYFSHVVFSYFNSFSPTHLRKIGIWKSCRSNDWNLKI